MTKQSAFVVMTGKMLQKIVCKCPCFFQNVSEQTWVSLSSRTAVQCPGGDAQNECPIGMRCIAGAECAKEAIPSWLKEEEVDHGVDNVEPVEGGQEEDMGQTEPTVVNEIGNTMVDGVLLKTNSPISSPVPADNDISDTFFCGVDRDDASASCHKRCRSGSPGECPGKLDYFIYLCGVSNTLTFIVSVHSYDQRG